MDDVVLRVVGRPFGQLVLSNRIDPNACGLHHAPVVLRIVLATPVEGRDLVAELLLPGLAIEHEADVPAGSELGVRDRPIDKLLPPVGRHLLKAERHLVLPGAQNRRRKLGELDVGVGQPCVADVARRRSGQRTEFELELVLEPRLVDGSLQVRAKLDDGERDGGAVGSPDSGTRQIAVVAVSVVHRRPKQSPSPQRQAVVPRSERHESLRRVDRRRGLHLVGSGNRRATGERERRSPDHDSEPVTSHNGLLSAVILRGSERLLRTRFQESEMAVSIRFQRDREWAGRYGALRGVASITLPRQHKRRVFLDFLPRRRRCG